MSEPKIEIPDYEVIRELGRGGMGVVYLARQLSLQREVALKVVSRVDVSAEAARRFIREVKLCASLSHPNIVKLLDAGSADPWMYLAMEYVEGHPMNRYVFQNGPLPPPRLLKVMEELADALDALHAQGIVHRDIKPPNIMIEPSGVTKLMDLGLARSETSTVLTSDKAILGSPRYLAPETVLSATMNTVSDLYGLGVSFYEMATGAQVFHCGSLREVLEKIVSLPLTPPTKLVPDFPPSLEEIVLRLVEKKPEDRYRSAKHLARAVRELRESADFLGTSWATAIPAEGIGVVLDPAAAPASGPVGTAPGVPPASGPATSAPGAARPTGKHPRTRASMRIAVPAIPQPEKRRPALAVAAVAVAILAGLALPRLLGRPGEGAHPKPVPTPVASRTIEPSGSPVSPSVGEKIDRLAAGVARCDLKEIVEELERRGPRRLRVLRGVSPADQPARLAAAHSDMIALLARRAFHAPFVDLVGSESVTGSAAGRSLLDDPALSLAARTKLYHALVFLSHIDDFVQNRCGLDPVYHAQDLLAPWASIFHLDGRRLEDLDEACKRTTPGGRCVRLHENKYEACTYLFSGLEPVRQMIIMTAGPIPMDYRKHEDDPLPVATLPGPYREISLIAMTEYVYSLRFVRFDFIPLPGADGKPPADQTVHTIVLRPARKLVNPEVHEIIGVRLSPELLPPGRYKIRIRAFRLMGVENDGCRLFRLCAQTRP